MKRCASAFARGFCRRTWRTIAKRASWEPMGSTHPCGWRGEEINFPYRSILWKRRADSLTDRESAGQENPRLPILEVSQGTSLQTLRKLWSWKYRTPQMQQYDLVTIGSGPGGQRAAIQ